jgi:hypothetical protein
MMLTKLSALPEKAQIHLARCIQCDTIIFRLGQVIKQERNHVYEANN